MFETGSDGVVFAPCLSGAWMVSRLRASMLIAAMLVCLHCKCIIYEIPNIVKHNKQLDCKMEQKYLVIDNYFICNMATRTVKWLLFPLEGPPVRLAPLPRLLPSHGGLPAHAPGATRRSAADGAPPCFERFGKIGRSPTYIEKHEETQVVVFLWRFKDFRL